MTTTRVLRPPRLLSGIQLTEFQSALILSQVLSVLFWAVALWVRGLDAIPVWWDTEHHFLPAAMYLTNPYALPGNVYVPWTLPLLVPLSLFSVTGAALLQACLLFGLLTAAIFKFGGNLSTVLIVLFSFMALDNALEINIDWLIALSLIIPRECSLPLLLIKPQDAIGVLFSYPRRDVIRGLIVCLAVILASLIVWGFWPLPMWAAIQRYSLGRPFNIAPLVIMPWPIALCIGVALAYHAWKRHDPAVGVLAGLFFVPYTTFYSLLIPFAMLAIKRPRMALIINLALWAIYGTLTARWLASLYR